MSKRLLHVMLCVVVTACAQLDIKEPIAKFQTATTAASTAIGSYYQELNTYERNLYLLERLVDPSKDVSLKEGGKQTPILGKPFSQDAIDARLVLFERIADYAASLGELAGTDAPARFQTNMNALGESLKQLDTDFVKLSQGQGGAVDATTNAYIQPITQLVGVIGKLALEKRRSDELRKALLEGEKPITDLLTFLEQDFRTYIAATRVTGQREVVNAWMKYYNKRRTTMSFAERKETLDRINAAALDIDAFGDPTAVIRKMGKAHAALVKLAMPDPTPGDFGAAAARIDEFVNQVQELVNAVIAIRDAKKGEHKVPKLATDQLAANISLLFDLAGDDRLSPTQRSNMSALAKRLRGRLVDLLSAQFPDDLAQVSHANAKLEALKQRLDDANAAINKIADTVKQITALASALDKLITLAIKFH